MSRFESELIAAYVVAAACIAAIAIAVETTSPVEPGRMLDLSRRSAAGLRVPVDRSLGFDVPEAAEAAIVP